MSSGQAPKRRSSSIIERSQYAPNRQQGDERRRNLDALGQDRAANERAKHDIAEIARRQGGRASAPVQLDDIEVQQRKPLRMAVTPAPLDPTLDTGGSSQLADDETVTPPPLAPAATDHGILPPPAVATTKQVRAKTAQQPAVSTTKEVRAKAPATRTRFEYVEHSPARSDTPARSMPKGYPTAYPRDEHYAPQEVYHYWESPVALARNNPLLVLLVVLMCGAVVWMYLQSPKTFISKYGAPSWSELAGDAAGTVLGAVDVQAGEHSVLGEPTISAAAIDTILAKYGSPAAGTGQVWVTLGKQYGIDPAYAVAFFIHESTAGTNPGWAGIKPDGTTTHNVGNIICAGYATCYGRFRDYASWDEGIADWYKLISIEYVNGRGAASVERIIPIYAPSSDNNDVPGYINVVVSMVESWRRGVLQ
jgi:hypothetical protein